MVLSDEHIEQTSCAMKARSHPLRLKILSVLGDREVSVKDIVELVGTSQSNISQHLAIMRDTGILDVYVGEPFDLRGGGDCGWCHRFEWLVTLYALTIEVPALAVGARRLHDIGKSGWFQLISIIPIVNRWLIVLFATEGIKGGNQYGADPKAGVCCMLSVVTVIRSGIIRRAITQRISYCAMKSKEVFEFLVHACLHGVCCL